MKEERYKFDSDKYSWKVDLQQRPMILIVTRKKPKVKVDYQQLRSFPSARYGEEGYGDFYIVQFKVSGWDGEKGSGMHKHGEYLITLSTDKPTQVTWNRAFVPSIVICLDARDKWSHPVLLPESIYTKLPEICKALEDKANN